MFEAEGPELRSELGLIGQIGAEPVIVVPGRRHSIGRCEGAWHRECRIAIDAGPTRLVADRDARCKIVLETRRHGIDRCPILVRAQAVEAVARSGSG